MAGTRAIRRWWQPLLLAGLLTVGGAADAASSKRVAGKTDGIWYWPLPTAPNGLTPTSIWSGAGSVPNGDIYVAGMDHVTNAALYRLPRGTNAAAVPGLELHYSGDAKAASQAINNWQPGDVAEKFHTRPTFHEGRIYVATLNDSSIGPAYLDKNGFHWYAYNRSRYAFVDISAKYPPGYGAEHGGLVGITVDAVRDTIYGIMSPTGQLYALDTNSFRSRLIGRPAYGRDYLYPGRALWTDRRGRVYFSAGHGPSYDPLAFSYVRYWDPVRGFGSLTSWRLRNTRSIDAVQCFKSPDVCFLSDDMGSVYRFVDPVSGSPNFQYLGNIGLTASMPSSWVFQVSPDRKFAYFLTKQGRFYQFDLVSRTVRQSFPIATYDSSLQGMVFYGHDAWDRDGRFYIGAFGQQSPNMPRARLLAIDPLRLLAAAAPPAPR
jgi:hypothetical protein